jgi:glucose/mannose-6-phosphate isomerase
LAGRLNEGIPLAQNPAKKLATKLAGHLIVVYGAGILSQVAYRWKTQFNENSKTWAFHEVFPELNHNAVVGYQFPRELAAGAFVILLGSNSINPRILVRSQLTAELLTRVGIEHEVVPAEGASPLSQMMSLVLFGDYVSCYLALLNGVDPWPVEAIDQLKEQLMLHNG